MAGTKAGAAKAVAKILANDPGHFARAGRIGGKNGHTGGFAANRELARKAGKIGGAKSRRRPAPTGTLQEDAIVIVRGNSMNHEFEIGQRIRVTKPGEQSFLGVSMNGFAKWYVANKDVTIDRR